MKSPKTRNNGTMTEAAFWSFIRSSLRRRTIVWKPINEVKKEARRPYVGENKRRKWEYQCASCKGYFSDKEIQVDHKIEAGSLRSGKDLEGFVERLFCEKEGLQVLCRNCHLEKSYKKKTDENKRQ